ncbi:MAG: D-serine ammonia-lyase [Ruminococcaceae bacterium]|nr:D-serine ammonia-lyase [Oscillospiraceae bacterium]
MLENKIAIENVSKELEQCWINPFKMPFESVKGLSELAVSKEEIFDAEQRLLRFAPFIKKEFPETAQNSGIIESPLLEINQMKAALNNNGHKICGRLFLKLDSHLPIAGSVKARGGIYEVLKHAESLAVSNGLIKESENYEKLSEFKEFFKDYTVQVGSTGNLGMSIGIISAAIGFSVKIHMSADAKKWKKDLLRSKGVEVIEYADDYTYAVEQGRKASAENPKSYFVDDEWSKDLFLGYSVAANRLKNQLEELKITVDEKHPLFVYIPAGVGGAPGGISYGLKFLFGDNVHCFFAEPTAFPSVMLGISTGLYEKANVKDYGVVGKSNADGLACPAPSGFVTRIMQNHLSGDFTVKDKSLFNYLRLLYSSENIKIEPSACAGFEGAIKLLEYDNTKEYLKNNNITDDVLQNSTHIVWATGGKMVPEENFNEFLNTSV